MIILPESYHSNTDALDIQQIKIWNPEMKVKFFIQLKKFLQCWSFLSIFFSEDQNVTKLTQNHYKKTKKKWFTMEGPTTSYPKIGQTRRRSA